MKFAEEVWKKQMEEHFDRALKILEYVDLRQPVKHYKIKRFMNRVFRTKFKLYEEPNNAMKFMKVSRPCIKN